MRPRLFLLTAVAATSLIAGCSFTLPISRRAAPATPTTPGEPSLSPLPAFDTNEDRIVQVVERVRPAVVNVRTSLEAGGLGGRGNGEGTGFIIRSEGIVVTNYHVVEGTERPSIRVVMADGRSFSGRVIGGDPDADLAVIQLEAEESLPFVPLGSSADLQLGEPVIALGFALGLEGGPSVTSGIVSALGRTIEAGGPGVETRTYEGLIQTDAAINPGNSGGPLVDLSGRVVGINTAGVQAAAAENIGFAISIDRARAAIEKAIRDPAAPQAYMGVITRTVTPIVRAELGLTVGSGAVVTGLDAGGPSDRAGIEPGDVIVRIAGKQITSTEAILDAIIELEPGTPVDVVVVRIDGEQETVRVTLGTRPLPIEQE